MDYFKNGASPVVDSWLFMSSPKPVFTLIVTYLLFVLKVGPLMMKNRKPFELKKYIIAYNFVQVIFAIFLIKKCLSVDFPLLSLFSSKPCWKNTPENLLKGNAVFWWVVANKVTELMDTVFFILKKSYRQISFLHVYHHSSIVVTTWMFLKYAPDYQCFLVGIINSSVHVIMYSYYMVAAMGPKYRKYIWWKKYITIIQLTQFCIVIVYVSTLWLRNCDLTRNGTLLLFSQAVAFLFMFSNFYKKEYTKKELRNSAKSI